jgi:hypothetical protein
MLVLPGVLVPLGKDLFVLVPLSKDLFIQVLLGADDSLGSYNTYCKDKEY